MFGRWLPAACLLVACGSPKSDVAPQDTSGADVQDVDKVSDVARPDTSMDTEVTETEVKKDSIDKETDSQTEGYHLAGVEVQRDEEVRFPHNKLYQGGEREWPSQARLFALPFGMRLLSDGATIRIGVLWFNGFGAYIYNKSTKYNMVFGPYYCQDPVDGLLPSGVVYYDLNTQTEQVSFVGETVFTLWTAESMRHGFPRAMETYGALGPHGSQEKCFFMEGGWQTCIEQWGTAITVGPKEYVLPMCRNTWTQEMGPPPSFAMVPGRGRGCNEREATALKSDGHESGFVDTGTKLLHLLFARELATGEEATIPLPLDSNLITREEALVSGCVQGANNTGDFAYDCGPGTPFSGLFRACEWASYTTSCACVLPVVFASPIEYQTYLGDTCESVIPQRSARRDAAYLLPNHGDGGAILFTAVPQILVLELTNQGVDVLPFHPLPDDRCGWNPVGSWYVRGHSANDTIHPIGSYPIWVQGDDGQLRRGNPQACYTWDNTLVEGGKIKCGITVEEVGGKRVLGYALNKDTDWTMADICITYDVDAAYSLYPACNSEEYGVIPVVGPGDYMP